MEKTEEFMKPEMTYSDTLCFTPYAYAKLLWMRDRGETEVAGYCVTGTKDPLLITDFVLIKQKCTSVTFDFDPDDAAEYMESMLDDGLMPWMYTNVLAHTHPGDSPNPSGVDEDNFRKAFSHPDWAIMLIIAQDNSMYCRLKLNVGPGAEKLLKVEIDFSQEFRASDHTAWAQEYTLKVSEERFLMTGLEGLEMKTGGKRGRKIPFDQHDEEEMMKWMEQYRQQDEAEQEYLRHMANANDEGDEGDESVCGDCYWDTDGNVCCWNEDTESWYLYDPIAQQWFTEAVRDGIETFVQIDIEKSIIDAEWAVTILEWADKYADERTVQAVNQ